MVYNLSVDNEHVYYANNYLVHNKNVISEADMLLRFEVEMINFNDAASIDGGTIDSLTETRQFQIIQGFNGKAGFSFDALQNDLGSDFNPAALPENQVQTGAANGAEYAGVPGMQDYDVAANCNNGMKYAHLPGVVVIKNGVCDVNGDTVDFRNKVCYLKCKSRRSPGCDSLVNQLDPDANPPDVEMFQLLAYTCNAGQKDKIISNFGPQAVISHYDGRFLKINYGTHMEAGQGLGNSCNDGGDGPGEATTNCPTVLNIDTGPTSTGLDDDGNFTGDMGFCNGYDPDFGTDPFSDRRLKYDIKLVGKSPTGINIYNFKYKNKKHGSGTYQGVMADEVPYASKRFGKYFKVDYSKIDVKFKKIK